MEEKERRPGLLAKVLFLEIEPSSPGDTDC